MKVAIASGRPRFLVGDPRFQVMTFWRAPRWSAWRVPNTMPRAGRSFLDPALADQLSPLLDIAEWRTDVGTGERFARLWGSKAG